MAEEPQLSVRELVRRYGKETYIQQEMIRLGFWPPDPSAEAFREYALENIKLERETLDTLYRELAKIEGEIRNATDVEKIIAEIKRKRIERVRQEREIRRAERARLKTEHQAADHERRQNTPPFLGAGVSAGLRYEGGASERLQALGLPELTTAADLAGAIGISTGTLSWLTYHRGVTAIDHYHRFQIPKSTGGMRTISSPKSKLRVAQSWILNNILTKIEIHEAAMAFRPGRSIVDNANLHQNKAVVIRIDLKDFFPSITFPRVKGLFESFGYNEGTATILALLSTEAPRVPVKLDENPRFVAVGARQLPQGACTSPAITNILCRKMDRRLSGLARSVNFTYTRYADDCVFSTENKDVQLGAFLKPLRDIIVSEGFVIKEEKTLIMRPHQRQTVTGLVVNNEDPALSRHDLRQFRAFLHHCETEGLQTVSEKQGRNALAYARGYLSFIQMVNPNKADELRKAHSWLV